MNIPLRTIMLVEDDPDLQLITRISLEVGGGYDVRVCGGGAEAVLTARAYPPDLILLDLTMPGMDGLATIAALRELPALTATPVIFFTANTQEEIRQDLLRRGALGVIVKPIEPDALVGQIRALWQKFAPTASAQTP